MANDDLRICFVGDSYVNGTGDPEYLGWTGRLAIAARRKGYHLTYYNLGVRRETSIDIARRWQQEVEVRLPSTCTPFVVFALGVNDTTVENGQRRVAEAQSVDNLHAILCEAKARYAVALIGPPPLADTAQNRRTQELSARFARIAQDEQVPFLSVFEVLASDADWMREVASGDGAHPGAIGYARLAALVDAWPEWWFR